MQSKGHTRLDAGRKDNLCKTATKRLAANSSPRHSRKVTSKQRVLVHLCRSAFNDKHLQTWLDNDECVSIPNSNCCVQSKRSGQRAAGKAIYHKQNNSHAVTPHMDIIYRQTSGLSMANQDIGDICVAEAYLKMDNQ
ncbi:hypothetical protein TNCV_729591, partial [Trichonephila clavipes]